MEKEEIIAFKNELRNYRYYKKKTYSIEDKIRECEYKLSGLKSPSFEYHVGTTNEEEKRERYYKQLDILERLRAEKNVYIEKVRRIDLVLDKVRAADEESTDMLVNCYVNKIPYRKLCSKYYIDIALMHRKIDKALKKVNMSEV